MIEENLVKFLENKKRIISFKFKKLKKKLNDDCYILKINKMYNKGTKTHVIIAHIVVCFL